MLFGPALAHAEDTVTWKLHWLPNTESGGLACTDPPGPVAAQAYWLADTAAVKVRLLLHTEAGGVASARLVQIRVRDVTPNDDPVPDYIESNAGGLPYQSEPSLECQEPPADAYFEFPWPSDSSGQNGGSTAFPNGLYEIHAVIEYDAGGAMGGVVTVRSSATVDLQNLFVENTSTFANGTLRTIIRKPHDGPIRERISVRISSRGSGRADVRFEILNRRREVIATIVKANEPYPTGFLSVTWDGVMDLMEPGDRQGGQAPAGIYFFRVTVNPGQPPGDMDPSLFVTINLFSLAVGAYDPVTRAATMHARYRFTTQNNRIQDNPPCSAGRIDLYYLTAGGSIEKYHSIPLTGDELKPGTRTKWLFFTCPEGYTPEQIYYVLELTDSHRLRHKSRVNRRVLQRQPDLGVIPRADNFDYIYPDVSSDDLAGHARSKQRALRDGSFYQAFDDTNRPASDVFNAIQQDALFYFFGHGAAPAGLDVWPMLICWNGATKTYLVDRQNLKRKLTAAPFNVPEQNILALDQLADNALNQMLLAVLEGCFTAFNTEDDGSPADGMVRKGARAALGFTAAIYNPQARQRAQYFWDYATQGWVDPETGQLTEVGYRTAARRALERVWRLNAGQLRGLDSIRFVGTPGDPNPDFKIYPAGLRDDR